MGATPKMSAALSDYTNFRTLPALLSVAFVIASLYQFGGISQVSLPWFEYTLTTDHAILLSLLAFVIAFASSETRAFEHYQDWEQVVIVLGPALIIGFQYVGVITDLVRGFGDPLGLQLAFVATVVSWSVAVR
ncbi:hypothetical protein [Halanaeroarchaeum sulfurireducens]|uniref:Uncharacterized protein n=1 Tax=Halanaeroarchaeum sulfurireducens TaxID=1604004 RepID=A0A0F7PCI5_9EURY|nr:hypothetical protein [Halanaeroarchaeum sulfurireducens]AKH97354.1 hypothetical protein HLASF_0861 [Halanaeroarchaeum sulfurireducens]ALG81756.1 hypothetical protein HLASA_0858 [Halanaeroarchaeum sulfurireducens]